MTAHYFRERRAGWIRKDVVTNDPSSKPDQRYARRRERQITSTFGKLSINLGLRAKKNSKLVQNIGKLGGCRLRGCCCKDYVSVARRNSVCSQLTLILLTWRIWWAPNNASKWQMGFNSAFNGLRVVTVSPLWPPVNKNILWSFRHTSIGQMFMLDQGCGRDAIPDLVRRQFLAETRASKLKGNTER